MATLNQLDCFVQDYNANSFLKLCFCVNHLIKDWLQVDRKLTSGWPRVEGWIQPHCPFLTVQLPGRQAGIKCFVSWFAWCCHAIWKSKSNLIDLTLERLAQLCNICFHFFVSKVYDFICKVDWRCFTAVIMLENQKNMTEHAAGIIVCFMSSLQHAHDNSILPHSESWNSCKLKIWQVSAWVNCRFLATQ